MKALLLLLAALPLAAQPGPKPAPAPARWEGLIGEYGPAAKTAYVIERGGSLVLLDGTAESVLAEKSADQFESRGVAVSFRRDSDGRSTEVRVGETVLRRRADPAAPGQTFRITPLKPVDVLREETKGLQPPREAGNFRKPELIDLTTLDRAIRLDIRYASTNNFMSSPFYTQARAFLQRPAAEALVRAHRKLANYGYGLLIHDAYRPWSVTKMFWEGTPPDKRQFVANPVPGSRHNRGCAVDLTSYERGSGQPAVMTGGYDEMSERSYPKYPGGTSLQRWQRDLLRWAMESEGFTVNEVEWWHFDYKDWKLYPILNVPFEAVR